MNLHTRKSTNPRNKNIFSIDFHHFTEIEKNYNSLEIAEEFGISLKDVKVLKQKMNRT